MSRQTIRHDAARSDILSEAYYIAEDNLDASDQFLLALEDAFQRLADFPGMGVRRDYKLPALQGMKFWRLFGFYIVRETSSPFLSPKAKISSLPQHTHGGQSVPLFVEDGVPI